MATLKINRSDRFPIGTTVRAYYTQRAKQLDSKPVGAAVEEHAVDAEGVLTFTTLAANVRYTLWAEVGGEHRYMMVEGPQAVAAPVTTEGQTAQRKVTLLERIGLRKQLSGTAMPVPVGGDY